MSLFGPILKKGKRCLVYCGDDRCDCDCNPRYLRYRSTYSFNRNYTSDLPITTSESEQNLDDQNKQ
jgi:hypothetical protein